MRGRHWTIVAVLGVAVVLAALSWTLASPKGKQQNLSADPPLPSTPGRPAAPLSAQDARQLSSDLAAGTDAAVASAVALPSAQTIDPAALRQIQALGPVTFDTATFHDDHDGTATVTAHLKTGGSAAASTWTVHLIDVDGLWKISLTEPTS